MTDDRMESTIGTLLRAGVMVAAAVVLAGGVWYLAASGSGVHPYDHFRPEARGLTAFGTLPAPLAVILAGLLLLLATPIARVVFALIAFALERDRVYVAITALVLAILIYSLGTNWL